MNLVTMKIISKNIDNQLFISIKISSFKHSNNNMQPIKFIKLHPDAVMPTKANNSDAGFDLTAISAKRADDYTYMEYGTGIAIEIPENWVGLIFQRSSVSRVQQSLSNAVGVIDSGYRGEISFRFRDVQSGILDKCKRYEVGDRIGQIIFMPLSLVELVETSELSDSDRGNNGFGSSGK